MSQQRYEESVRQLARLGFTELEALVYSFLVEHSPATGYRVAHAIGKPVANTYKAIESLRAKGALDVNPSGDSRSCRAVQPNELLTRLRRRFDRQHADAERALAALSVAAEPTGIYTLTSVEQVFERALLILEGASEVALLDLFPSAVERLGHAMEEASARGVAVAAQVYADPSLSGVETILSLQAEESLERWPGQWLSIVVDGSQYLVAYLDAEVGSVIDAVWSDSAFLSWVQHSYLGSTLREQILERLVRETVDPCRLEAVMGAHRRWSAADAPGFRQLRQHFDQKAGTTPKTQK